MRIQAQTFVAFGLSTAAMLLLVFLSHRADMVAPPPPTPDASSYLYQVVSIPFLLAFGIAAAAIGARLFHPIAIGMGMVSPLAIALVLDLSRKPTSHNLFPFEIVMLWLPVFLISFGMAHLGARLMRGRPHDSSSLVSDMDAAINRLRENSGFRRDFSISDAIAKWRRHVEEVERGYRASVHDFTADLQFRDDLDELLDRLGDDRDALSQALVELDARFLQATVPSDKPFLPALSGERQGERWFRRPANLAPSDEDVSATWRA